MIKLNYKEELLFLMNNDILSIDEFNIDILNDCKVIYEVIRVVGSKPLFLNEHFERLIKSCDLSGIKCPNIQGLKSSIYKLLEKNPVKEKNLKISIGFNKQVNSEPQLLAYFIASFYPSEEDFRKGIKVELLPAIRNNPNVKLENPTMRGSAEKVICISQTSEALLVDNDGFITEGSRSNFFALKNNTIFTPPSDYVLKGITRSKVIELCSNNQIPLQEIKIHTSEIGSFEGAFITGTSSKVLPIRRIGNIPVEVGQPLITRVMELYNDLTKKELIG
jgi:branched-chain amino acid aminotransferase